MDHGTAVEIVQTMAECLFAIAVVVVAGWVAVTALYRSGREDK